MGNIRLYGSTSGYTELAPPAVAGTTALTFPATAGTVATQAYANTAGATLGGLVHITTQSFSAASTVSVNNCFTSGYDNYKIIISNVVGSTNTGSSLRLRVSGTDSSTSYASYGRYMGAVGNADFNVSSATSFGGGALNTDSRSLIIAEVSNPNLAVHTYCINHNAGRNSGGFIYDTSGNYHQQNTAYDGFSYIVSGGTATGVIRVYGYRNA